MPRFHSKENQSSSSPSMIIASSSSSNPRRSSMDGLSTARLHSVNHSKPQHHHHHHHHFCWHRSKSFYRSPGQVLDPICASCTTERYAVIGRRGTRLGHDCAQHHHTDRQTEKPSDTKEHCTLPDETETTMKHMDETAQELSNLQIGLNLKSK